MPVLEGIITKVVMPCQDLASPTSVPYLDTHSPPIVTILNNTGSALLS